MVGSAIFSVASVLPTTGFAGTLAGYKFNDVNKDQQCNMLGSIPAEPVFADETITIRNDDSFESTEIQTDENGYFSFEGVGDFSILLTYPPSGWSRTTPVAGSGTLFYQVTFIQSLSLLF